MRKESSGEYKIGVGEKIIQPEMYCADLLTYHSQLDSFPWQIVAEGACGITAATMAISLKKADVTPLDVMNKACQLHTMPGEGNYWLRADDGEAKLTIPIGTSVDPNLKHIISLDDRLSISRDRSGDSIEYKPVFSINNGYDHRGSERLFAEFGIRAERLGTSSEHARKDNVVEAVKNGGIFMASVTNKEVPWMDYRGPATDTHVLLLTDVVTFLDREWYWVVDPYSPSTDSKATFLRQVDEFHEGEFNGYGTIVYPNEEAKKKN